MKKIFKKHLVKRKQYSIIFAIIFAILFSLTYATKISFAITAAPLTLSGSLPIQSYSYGVHENYATSITPTSAHITGSINSYGVGSGASYVSTWGFKYGTTSSYGSTVSTTQDSSTSAPTGSSFSSDLTGLSPCTTYYYQAYSLNPVGNGLGYGSTVTTDCNPAVVTGSSTSVASTTATLNGNLTTLGGWASSQGTSGYTIYVSNPAIVGFHYGTTTAYGTDTATSSQSGTGTFSNGLTGLTACTTYHYQAYAINYYTATGTDHLFTTACTPPTVTASAGSNSAPGSDDIGYIPGGGGAPYVTGIGTLTSYGGYASSTLTEGVGIYTAGGSPLYAASLSSHVLGTIWAGTFSMFAPPTQPTILCGGMYQVLTIAENLSGTIVATSSAPFTACNSVYTGSATNVSSSSEIIYGSLDYTAGTSTAYGFSGSFPGSPITVGTTAAATTTAYNTTLTGLTCGTYYTYTAIASAVSGAGSSTGLTAGFTPPCPPVVSTATTTSSAFYTPGTSINLSGTISSIGSFSSSAVVGIQYGTSTAYGLTSATSSATSTGTFSYLVSGLTCGTTYHYRAFGTNGGTGYGADASVTSPCPTNPAIVTGSSTSITATSSTLNATVTSIGTYYLYGDLVSSNLYYGTTTAYGSQTASTTTATGPISGSATGLSACTTYHYMAVTTNLDYNYTATGTDQTFNTSCIPPTVTTVGVSSISQNSATLTGSITYIGQHGGTATAVGFQYGTTIIYGQTASNGGSSFGVGNFSVTPASGFSCNTTYHYRAFATNFTTGYGADKTFTTAPCIGTNGNVTGYAWGSYPGWISLNCAQGLIGTSTQANTCGSSQYSVNVTPNFTTHVGTFSGYAWNPTNGWVSFNPSETSSCGSAAKVDLSTGTSTSGIVSGWAKFLSPSGWSGCISLSTVIAGQRVIYIATSTTYNLAGPITNPSSAYLGSAGRGVIAFTYANLNLATSTLQFTVNGATSTTLTSIGGNVSLVWTATNMTATNCTASSSDNSWRGSISSGGGSQLITIGANTGTSTITKTYTISGCTSITGTTAPSQSVTVTIPPSTNSVLIFKANGAGDVTPLTVTTGDAVTLSWQIQNISGGLCNGTSTSTSGALGGWNSTSKAPLSGVASTSTPITYTEVIIATSTRSYTMTCGPTAKTVNIITNTPAVQPAVSLTVNGGSSAVVPTTGGTVTLQWVATNLDNSNCTASSSDGLWSGSKSYLGGTDSITIPSSTTTSRSYTLSGCLGNGAVIPPQTVTITAGTSTPITLLANGASTAHIGPGQAVTLSWLVQGVGANSCVGTSSGNFSGWNSTTKLPSSGVSTSSTFYEVVGADGSITSNRTYTMTCGGTHVSTANIITDLSCVGNVCGSRSNSDLTLTADGEATENIGAATSTVSLVWTTSNVTSTACTATSSDGLWTGSKSSSGGNDSITIPVNMSTSTTITHTYTMSGCVSAADGSIVPSQSATVTQIASGTSAIISFTANGVDSSIPLTITSGSQVTFSWTVQNVNANKCSGRSSGNFTGWNSSQKAPSTAVTTAQTFYEYGDGADGSITSSRTYTFGCVGVAASKTITINVIPPIINNTCVGSSCGSATGTVPTVNAFKRPPWMEI